MSFGLDARLVYKRLTRQTGSRKLIEDNRALDTMLPTRVCPPSASSSAQARRAARRRARSATALGHRAAALGRPRSRRPDHGLDSQPPEVSFTLPNCSHEVRATLFRRHRSPPLKTSVTLSSSPSSLYDLCYEVRTRAERTVAINGP